MERVEGKHVTVVFDGKRCVHSRNRVLSHPEVFVPNVFVPNVKGEWIFPDAAAVAIRRTGPVATAATRPRDSWPTEGRL